MVCQTHERLAVVMPVYNERDAIGPVLEKWAVALDALGVDYVIRPYNDGSKDDSLTVMRTVAARHPGVEVRDKSNGGHGNTILTGYREAAADGYDWVFQVDSDDEMGPEKFGELWTVREKFDFLVGIRDGRVQALPRKAMSFVSRLCVRLFYGRSVWDVNTPYRLMRVSAFRSFFEAIPLMTFAPNVILSGLAARHGLRCHEIRVPQHDRTTGEVSIRKWRLLKAAAKSFSQTVGFAFGFSWGERAALRDFVRRMIGEVRQLPQWWMVSLLVALVGVYGITCFFPSMVYDFAAAKGDRLQVFLTYFFMRRYTEGAVSALFYNFSPIWSNVVELSFLFLSLLTVGVLMTRLKLRRLAGLVGVTLWAVTPVVYGRLVGQHCVPSTGIGLFLDSLVLLLFQEIRSESRISWPKFLAMSAGCIVAAGEYQAHLNLLLTAFCGICLVAPRTDVRGWFLDLALIGATLFTGAFGWFCISYGPVLAAGAVGVVIPPSGGAGDHVHWIDAGLSLGAKVKALLAGFAVDFGYASFFLLGIRLAVVAWFVWLVKATLDVASGRIVRALYVLTFSFSVFFHSVLQCSTNAYRVYFCFMPFVGLSFALCVNWALSRRSVCRVVVLLAVFVATVESCHETADLYYFHWKIMEQDRLHAGTVATDLWRRYGTVIEKPIVAVGSLGRYPTNWHDQRPFRFLPQLGDPLERTFSNMSGYNCPREFYMFMRELTGFVCTMPPEPECRRLKEVSSLITDHPAYPQPGYIFETNGTIIVNFGDRENRWRSFDYADWRSPNEQFLFRTLKLDWLADSARRLVYPPFARLWESAKVIR